MPRLSSVDELKELRDMILGDADEGRSRIVVCAGTACQASGSNDIMRIAKKHIMEKGLIDKVGDSQEAILLAAALGGIKDKKPKVIRRSADSVSSILELLESRVTGMVSPRSALLREFEYQLGGSGLEYRWR